MRMRGRERPRCALRPRRRVRCIPSAVVLFIAVAARCGVPAGIYALAARGVVASERLGVVVHRNEVHFVLVVAIAPLAIGAHADTDCRNVDQGVQEEAIGAPDAVAACAGHHVGASHGAAPHAVHLVASGGPLWTLFRVDRLGESLGVSERQCAARFDDMSDIRCDGRDDGNCCRCNDRGGQRYLKDLALDEPGRLIIWLPSGAATVRLSPPL